MRKKENVCKWLQWFCNANGPKVLSGDGDRSMIWTCVYLIAAAREEGGFCCLFPLSFQGWVMVILQNSIPQFVKYRFSWLSKLSLSSSASCSSGNRPWTSEHMAGQQQGWGNRPSANIHRQQIISYGLFWASRHERECVIEGGKIICKVSYLM